MAYECGYCPYAKFLCIGDCEDELFCMIGESAEGQAVVPMGHHSVNWCPRTGKEPLFQHPWLYPKCPNCNEDLHEVVDVCPNCGMELDWHGWNPVEADYLDD